MCALTMQSGYVLGRDCGAVLQSRLEGLAAAACGLQLETTRSMLTLQWCVHEFALWCKRCVSTNRSLVDSAKV